MCAGVAHDPRHVDALISRGSAHHLQGRVEPAMADFNQAIRIDPNNADAYGGRGALYMMTSRFPPHHRRNCPTMIGTLLMVEHASILSRYPTCASSSGVPIKHSAWFGRTTMKSESMQPTSGFQRES